MFALLIDAMKTDDAERVRSLVKPMSDLSCLDVPSGTNENEESVSRIARNGSFVTAYEKPSTSKCFRIVLRPKERYSNVFLKSDDIGKLKQ